MRNFPTKMQFRFKQLLPVVLVALTALFSCSDPYMYDNQEPDWLGGSIYKYLTDQQKYKTTINLIDDLGYTEMMSLTGSKTLFVVTDSAFNEFYKNNTWGVKKYDDFTLAQKKLLMNYSIVNNAYLLSSIVDYFADNTTQEERAMRRSTALSPLDSIAFKSQALLPDSKYWKPYVNSGIYLMEDDSYKPTVYFTQDFLNTVSITNDDFKVLNNGVGRVANDVHLFGDKVVKSNITCKNGYVHVLDNVLLPPLNMAQYIETNPSTKIFSKLVNRFCAPYYSPSMTSQYKQLSGRAPIDSIFVKRYFTSSNKYSPDGSLLANYLPYDPGQNNYAVSGSVIYPDMAAMFIPTDDAMNAYFNSGVGEILKKRFGYWDSVPDNIIIPFLKRHMRTSLIESVPSRFAKMVDAENYSLPVTIDQIASNYTGVNGHVYTTNEVYPPVDYISVYSPILLSSNTNIINWAISQTETSVDGTPFAFYKLYINSLVSKYSVFVPTDEYFQNTLDPAIVLDPIAYGQDAPQGGLQYKYNGKTKSVYAVIRTFNKNVTPITFSDSLGVITDATFIKNRLNNLLDGHIVVGDVESGNPFYVTKGNDIIKIDGKGENMKIEGGYDTQMNTPSSVTKVFKQTNGTTYFINKPIQPSLRSVFNVLSNTDEYKPFFELLNGVPDTCVYKIFSPQGIDYKVNFFNAYRYTIYVPTESALKKAFDNNLILSWDSIYKMPQGPAQAQEINKVIRFLRYHFQDDAVFVGQSVDETYQSATIKTNSVDSHFHTGKNRYYKIGVKGTSDAMTLTTETNNEVHVIKQPGLYNVVAKDYIFAKLPSAYKNVNGTGASSAAAFSTSSITTSASAVIHLIDDILTFQ